MYASIDCDTGMAERALGPSTDLQIWIPKVAGASTPAALRPLQLPSTIRRVFAGVVASYIGPSVEPHFSHAQAARQG
eukprot:7295661-Prorocentrum_lima.AAC.1